MVEKCLYAKFGSESVAEKELQWSLTANAGVQYDFTRRTALYFEPGVSYYLTGNRVADGPDGFAGQFVFAVGRASDLLRRFR